MLEQLRANLDLHFGHEPYLSDHIFEQACLDPERVEDINKAFETYGTSMTPIVLQGILDELIPPSQ